MITRTAAAAALTVALGCLSAPPASADSGDFLNRVQDLGWYDDRGDAYLLDNGWSVCRAMSRGYSGTQVAWDIYRNTDSSVDANDAAEFVIIAVEELCPQYDHRGVTA